ncbi:MAG: GAF domain-containing protein [Chloroflexi bacterium]|nr:GAF domain-containing protein [Chloroflexota bacterium]
MTLHPISQILQTAAWFLVLIELVVALYILLLNAWHVANRHVSALLVLCAINVFAVGQLIGAIAIDQATLFTSLLAATSAAMPPALFIVAIVILKPQWLRVSTFATRRNLWRFAWWLAYGLVLLPALLTLIDVGLGTRLWYTGLDAGTYAGGYVPRTEYKAGSLSSFVIILNNYLVPLITLASLLYVAFWDKKVPPSTRRLAKMLAGIQITGIVGQFVIRLLIGEEITVFAANFLLVLGYAYAAFQQLISERRMQRGRLPVRLTAIILVVTVPVFLAILGLLVTHVRVDMEQATIERLEARIRALEDHVSVWLDFNAYALQQLVGLPDSVSMDAARQKPVLEAMADVYPHMNLVSTVDLAGVNVARSDNAAKQNYGDQLWFERARDGAPLTFQVRQDDAGEPELVVSVPIQDESGTIVGVGMFVSDLTAITQEFSQIGSDFAYIVDADNQVIAHADLAISGGTRFLGDYAPIVTLREGASGYVEFVDGAGMRWRSYVDALDNGWGIVVQQEAAALTASLQQFRTTIWVSSILSVIVLAILVSLAIRQAFQPLSTLIEAATAVADGDLSRIAPVESQDEIGILSDVFNSVTTQLRGNIGSLEMRVLDRTRELERRTRYMEASAQVAHDAASVLEPHQLLERVVSLISERFGFYHAGIFLVDDNREWAVLQAVSSEGGRRMLARNHQLRVGEMGIVGHVTGHGEPRVALDVGEDAVYFNNPDMPETRSEMALPLRVRDQVIGALDVQSKEPEAFSDDDVAVLQTLADQVAMALNNARLFQQAQESLEAQRRAYGAQSREAWTEMLRTQLTLGYYCDARGVTPVTERSVTLGDDGEDLPALDIPVTVHGGQVIGTINARKAGDAGEWTAEEISLMTTLTERLNVALESARLYQDTQRRAVREQLIGDVVTRVRETLDMETMLKTAAQQVRQALNLPEVTIRLAPRAVDKDGNGDGKG